MKNFFVQIFMFACIIYVCQLALVNIFPQRIPQPAINFNLAKQLGNIDIVYFIDSVNDTTDATDLDKGAISQFLQRILVCKKVGVIGQAASQPDVYAAYASYVSRIHPPPQYVIVEINMRTFGWIWDHEPSYQFDEHKLFFRAFADTPLMPFWSYISKTIFEDGTMFTRKPSNVLVYDFVHTFGIVQASATSGRPIQTQDSTADSIRNDYMYELSPQHRKVKSLLEIADLFRTTKTKVIFYFTPINYQLKNEYVGDTFERQLKKNIALVKQLLIEKDETVIDLSMALPSESFTWTNNKYNNEHLKEKGRWFVAESLAHEIQNN